MRRNKNVINYIYQLIEELNSHLSIIKSFKMARDPLALFEELCLFNN